MHTSLSAHCSQGRLLRPLRLASISSGCLLYCRILLGLFAPAVALVFQCHTGSNAHPSCQVCAVSTDLARLPKFKHVSCFTFSAGAESV
ncbi:hypothetical protein BDR07DRAFT_1435517 [Suillus spraguei]|nr:hypothetical protein BDR07DRAFT_1435517 [Suillus spraguei]